MGRVRRGAGPSNVKDVEWRRFSHQVGQRFGGGSSKEGKRTNLDLSFPAWNELETHTAVKVGGEGSTQQHRDETM